jgi:hypothetical protein
MSATASALRLSAVRAFLGRIHPEMRLIKVKMVGTQIVLTVVLSGEVSELVQNDISEAATEIVADFPSPVTIEENVVFSSSDLPRENVLSEGWVFQRA